MADFGRVLRRLLPASLFALAPLPAAALDCHTHDHFAGLLGETYGQSVRLSLVEPDGRVLEVWAAERGGWTLLSVTPSRAACVVARGRSWLTLPLLRSPGDPA